MSRNAAEITGQEHVMTVDRVSVEIEGDEATIHAPVDPSPAEQSELSTKLVDAVLARAATEGQQRIVHWAKLGRVVEQMSAEYAEGADKTQGFGLGIKLLMARHPDAQGASEDVVDYLSDQVINLLLAKIYEMAGEERDG